MRYLIVMLTLLIALPSQAASLRETRLESALKTVAEQSSKGTPRQLNANIVDEGFTAQGQELINHLTVDTVYASHMQSDPLVVRSQLQSSVCADQRFRRLLDMGATLTYHFVLADSNQPVLTQSFVADHCQAM
ncbi:putative secreted protein [Pseudomonas saudimassiliensis]|uniref:Putative secreted protein n=1 Tax=Pseudomonas saudimassiliensis TaxID=1461581 RepID=A0A078M835_9PSED|nr:PA3611 family quorum-sensing-regulated virulence factor [Pseudomonas saudimassiliensis]CEA02459.1 putative secreted protein [Pseudomonas saudimassiliensis]CEF25844.1 putative secreted protein [Pseudomonas saudimassiliensis]